MQIPCQLREAQKPLFGGHPAGSGGVFGGLLANRANDRPDRERACFMIQVAEPVRAN